MGAFANGCTAMTGVEAVSNGVPLFREPAVANAQKTLAVIVAILSLFLLGLGYLCSVYHIGAMNELQPGYQTILSQAVSAVAGKGVFYYIALASIFVVLTYSAQTSFAGFPRVCRLLAEDGFLPHRVCRPWETAGFLAWYHLPRSNFRSYSDCLRRGDQQPDSAVCGWSV